MDNVCNSVKFEVVPIQAGRVGKGPGGWGFYCVCEMIGLTEGEPIS